MEKFKWGVVILIVLIFGMSGFVYAKEKTRGRTKERINIYDKDWQRKGYVKEGSTWSTIYDRNNQKKGYIKDGNVYDKNWNRILNTKDKK